MKKAFDQTVRDIKREVNKKVLKVPSIEQKVLDATSNEPWGPHGSLLADIAQATRNYHEYQMIMSVIWKRINDTGKNWRHVYKALTVLEYLVAHGAERVVDDIKEHAYQISTLSDFQYIDSNGRDQGNNVRKKSQSLVVLVNDKERILEVRQKAAANREKYRSAPVGGMYRPGGYGDRYDDDRHEGRYGNRDDDRNGYGRERDWGSRDEDRYGRYGDSYGRETDRYSRDSEDRYSRDGYRDDDYRGRSQSIDDHHYGSRSRSVDKDRDRGYEDDGHYSSRGSGVRADDHSQDGSTTGRRLDRKYSEQNLGAPPSYEDVVGAGRSPTYSERDGESSQAPALKASSPTSASPSHAAPAPGPTFGPASPPAPTSAQATAEESKEVDSFDEFDPRGSFSAATSVPNGAAPASTTAPAPAPAPAPSGDAGMDLLGSLSDPFSSNALALVPADQPTMSPKANVSTSVAPGLTFATAPSGSTISHQPFDDPFGDGPFKAIPSMDNVPAQHHIIASSNSFNANSSQSLGMPQISQNAATEFGGNIHVTTSMASGPSGLQPTNANTQFYHQSTPNQDIDILADILPPTPSSSFSSTQVSHPIPADQTVSQAGVPTPNHSQLQSGLPSLIGQNVPQQSFPQQPGQPAGFTAQPSQHATFPMQPGQPAAFPTQLGHTPLQTTSFPGQSMNSTFPQPTVQTSQMGFHSLNGQPAGFPVQMGSPQSGVQTPFGSQAMQSSPANPNFYGAYQSQQVSSVPPGAAVAPPTSSGPVVQHNFLSQPGSAVPVSSQINAHAPQIRPSSHLAPVSTVPSSTGSLTVLPQPSKDKFETKSTVWADTLSRGLVNLNISGSKTNPLADIGVDFDAINRKEKRMEKPTTSTVTSTITMGKAMGSGSGIGRAGASALRPAQNPMIGSGMNIAGTTGAGMSGGGYGVNQQMGRGMGMNMPGNMGMGMNMPGSMGMGMNMPGSMGMGMNQGIHMQQQLAGLPPGSTMPGGYNPMMGSGNYGQQPYGGGYR